MTGRTSFIIHSSFYPPIEGMTDEDLGQLFRALFQFNISGIEPINTSRIYMPFQFFKNQFSLDNAKYLQAVERNKANGAKGGRPAKKQPKPKKPTGLFKNPENPTEPRKPDNDNDNDNDNDKGLILSNDNILNTKTDFQFCTEIWLKDTHPDFTFGAVQGKQLKSIIKKIETLVKDRPAANIPDTFRYICQNLPEWFRDKDLAVIDSKFNEIISQIKNGKSNKLQRANDAAREALANIVASDGLDQK